MPTNTQTTLPEGIWDQPIWATDPVTKRTVDVRPLFEYMYGAYGPGLAGDLSAAEEAEASLQHYLSSDNADERPARELKRHLSASLQRQVLFDRLAANFEKGGEGLSNG